MESKSVPSPNWVELPWEVTAMILSRVDDFDIVRSGQFVCSSWRSVARDPLRWRSINMRALRRSGRRSEFLTMCLRAVDYSSGHLESITVDGFGSDHFLLCIAQRSNNIKRLRLRNCNEITDNGFCAAVSKLPLLEELELTRRSFSIACFESAGRNCPRLKSLTFRRTIKEIICPSMFSSWERRLNDEAIAIASNFPGLRNLDIAGNKLTDAGVEAILEGCPLLEKLDLRGCFNVQMRGDLHTRCKEKLKLLWRPFSHSLRIMFPHGYDDSDEIEPYVKHDIEDDWSDESEFSDNSHHQSSGNECCECDEDEFSESDHDEFSELDGSESECPYASDDDFSDVSDNESLDVSDDEFSESDDLGNESSGPEDSDDDYDHSDNNVSDYELLDASDDESSEGDDLGNESSGPEDSHDDYDHSDNSEYSYSDNDFATSSDDDI